MITTHLNQPVALSKWLETNITRVKSKRLLVLATLGYIRLTLQYSSNKLYKCLANQSEYLARVIPCDRIHLSGSFS